MKKRTARILTTAALAAAAAVLPAAVPAATQHAPVAQYHEPIKVLNCSPEQGTTWVNAGYVPAYYPVGVGPYWGWPSVYGPAYSYYSTPVQSNPTLEIDYYNNTPVTMKDIEFGLIANGRLVAEVRDVGTFSPTAEIKHSFGLNPNVFPLSTGLPHCVPLKITFIDGSKWKNPHLPALRRQIYGHPH